MGYIRKDWKDDDVISEEALDNMEAGISEGLRKSSQAKEEAAKVADDLAIERARLNNLFKLPEGSTTMDAELVDIRVGPDGKTYPSAGEAVRTQFTAKFDKANVAHELGASLDKVLSQEVVSKEITGAKSRLSRSEKRITNLEKGLPGESFLTDSSVAYSKTVPENALPYAEVGVIGGMTYKVNIGTEEEPEYELQHSAVTEIESSNSEAVLSALIIPDEVKSLDGYGWGLNESVYNYIDWEKKQFVKRVDGVDVGSLEWKYDSSGSLFYNESLGSQISPVTAFEEANMLTHKYKTYSNRQLTSESKDFAISFYKFSDRDGGSLKIRDTNYSDVTSFKAAMSGVMLYYELAEPILTDISHLLPSDNLIPVESGGTVTILNEYSYAVPSEITYMLKGE